MHPPAVLSRTNYSLRLPREHGFWVMLGGSVGGSFLRAPATTASALLALVVALGSVVVASAATRRVRSRASLQLAAALAFAFAGAPVEAAGGASLSAMAASVLVKAVVFVSSVLFVRAALVAAGKRGARRSFPLYVAALVLALAGAQLFWMARLEPEAGVCLVAAASALGLSWRRPTAKDLKALGLYASGLTLAATFAPVLR